MVAVGGAARWIWAWLIAMTICLSLGVAGCESEEKPPNLAPVPDTLVSLSVAPATAKIGPGRTQTFIATGTLSPSGTTRTLVEGLTWESSNVAVATIDAKTGIATGVDNGSVTITARLGALTATASLMCHVDRAELKVEPATVSVVLNETQAFTATEHYNDGTTADRTKQVRWSSSDEKVATIDASGTALANAIGKTTITATLDGSSVTATLTVTAPSVVSIDVTPPTASTAGGTIAFKATANYSNKSTADITLLAKWTSSDTSIATVDSAGLVTSHKGGTVYIIAEYMGQKGTASLWREALTHTLEVTTDDGAVTATIPKGGTKKFRATAFFTDASVVEVTSTADWTSSAPSVATVDASGSASAIADGIATITAKWGGKSASATLVVTGVKP